MSGRRSSTGIAGMVSEGILTECMLMIKPNTSLNVRQDLDRIGELTTQTSHLIEQSVSCPPWWPRGPSPDNTPYRTRALHFSMPPPPYKSASPPSSWVEVYLESVNAKLNKFKSYRIESLCCIEDRSVLSSLNPAGLACDIPCNRHHLHMHSSE